MTESGLNTPLPGIMQPNLFVSMPYEPTRIASYLPGAAMDGPSAFWLQHTGMPRRQVVWPRPEQSRTWGRR